MKVKFTKREAKQIVDGVLFTFENESSPQPCVYLYNEKIDFSAGSNAHGTAEPVYNGWATILIDHYRLREWVDEYHAKIHTKKDLTELVYKAVNDELE